MMAVPGDLVFATKQYGPGKLGLLIARLTDDALHEDDEYDSCIVVFAGSVKRECCLGKNTWRAIELETAD